jgi:hypothetical protein
LLLRCAAPDRIPLNPAISRDIPPTDLSKG